MNKKQIDGHAQKILLEELPCDSLYDVDIHKLSKTQ